MPGLEDNTGIDLKKLDVMGGIVIGLVR
jgi:hypothetical protein